jgi:hypothetical protein
VSTRLFTAIIGWELLFKKRKNEKTKSKNESRISIIENFPQPISEKTNQSKPIMVRTPEAAIDLNDISNSHFLISIHYSFWLLLYLRQKNPNETINPIIGI